MAGEFNFDAANGLVKKRYAKKLADLRPVSAVLQSRIAFDASQKLGEAYEVGVMLRPPNGITYSGSTAAAANLVAARGAVSKHATLLGHELNLVERITLKALSSAMEKGEQAIGVLLDETVLGMKKSAMNRVEASALRGQSSYGTAESATGGGTTSHVVTFTAATWAPGLFWHFGENSIWEIFNAGTNLAVTFTLTAINTANRTLSFTSSANTTVAAGYTLHPYGARTGASTYNEPLGLLAQAGNTGWMHGIDAAVYPAWAGNNYTVSGEFGLGVLEDVFSQLRDRGASGKLTAFVNNRAYGRIATEVMAQRMLDQSYSAEKAKVGSKSMSYFTADVDEVEIVKHPFLAWGESMILPEDECQRVGASEVTFGIPGMQDDLMVLVPGTNTVELQAFSDQAPIVKRPNHSCYISGITF